MSHHLSRGRRIDNEELVEGYYSPEFLIETHETGDFYPATKTIFNVISKDAETAYEITLDTLQRCTGWVDKNKNLAFEEQYFIYGILLWKIKYSKSNGCFYFIVYNKIKKTWEESRSKEIPEIQMLSCEVFDEVKFNDDGSWERVEVNNVKN